MREIIISKDNENQRLDKFLMKFMNKAPKSFIYKMLRKKNIKLDGKKAAGNEILKEGGVIALFLKDETIDGFREEKKLREYDIDFNIVYEDKHIIIADKPVGMLTQADVKDGDCLNSRILYYLSKKGELREDFVPSVCNRLDRNTGGLVTFGKTLRGTQELNLGFREHFIEKNYITIVQGIIKDKINVRAWHRKNGREAEITLIPVSGSKETLTVIEPLCSNGSYTLVKVGLETGKTHQIRAVLHKIGYPVAGDRKYGNSGANDYFYGKYGLKNQFLYCFEMIVRADGRRLDVLKNMNVRIKGDAFVKNIILSEFSVDFDNIL